MHLTMRNYPIQSIVWGEATQYKEGHLIINRNELMSHLKECGHLQDIHILDLALVVPNTKTRVVNIFDIFQARARLGKDAVDYPGVLGPVQTAGTGETANLENFAILAVSNKTDKYHKVLDMSGAGSSITPYSSYFHLAIVAEPASETVSDAVYHSQLKKVSLRIGSYLAREAAKSNAENVVNFTLDPKPNGLPKVAYICMIASHQKAVPGEAILYGDDVSGLLPTVLHPNEFLDGAVNAPHWNLGIDTLSFQNNPVVLDLYKRHGIDIDFAGVVVCVSHITRQKRELSVQMCASLAHSVLNCDLAVVSKVGGGIPESDLMMTVETLEKQGVKTSAIVWSYLGDGTVKDSISTFSPYANAVASAGMQDATIELFGQEIVIGGSEIGPFTDNPNDKPTPAREPVIARYRDVCGAINQLGASHVAQIEI